MKPEQKPDPTGGLSRKATGLFLTTALVSSGLLFMPATAQAEDIAGLLRALKRNETTPSQQVCPPGEPITLQKNVPTSANSKQDTGITNIANAPGTIYDLNAGLRSAKLAKDFPDIDTSNVQLTNKTSKNAVVDEATPMEPLKFDFVSNNNDTGSSQTVKSPSRSKMVKKTTTITVTSGIKLDTEMSTKGSVSVPAVASVEATLKVGFEFHSDLSSSTAEEVSETVTLPEQAVASLPYAHSAGHFEASQSNVTGRFTITGDLVGNVILRNQKCGVQKTISIGKLFAEPSIDGSPLVPSSITPDGDVAHFVGGGKFSRALSTETAARFVPVNPVTGLPTTAPDPSKATGTANPDRIPADGVSTSTITVQLKDKEGEPITVSSGAGKIVPLEGTTGETVDNGDGTYTTRLTSSKSAGEFDIGFRLGGGEQSARRVPGLKVTFTASESGKTTENPIPLTLTNTDGGSRVRDIVLVEFDLDRTTASASSATIPADGLSTSTITVQLRDKGGNPYNSSGGPGRITTILGTMGETRDNKDGTYTALLTSSKDVGMNWISFELGGTSIPAAAVKIRFIAPDPSTT